MRPNRYQDDPMWKATRLRLLDESGHVDERQTRSIVAAFAMYLIETESQRSELALLLLDGGHDAIA